MIIAERPIRCIRLIEIRIKVDFPVLPGSSEIIVILCFQNWLLNIWQEALVINIQAVAAMAVGRGAGGGGGVEGRMRSHCCYTALSHVLPLCKRTIFVH